MSVCCICFPFLSAFDCGRLDTPRNGRVRVTGTRPGSVASYSCNVGFNLEGGNENRRCVDLFGWDGSAPTCQRKCLSLYSCVVLVSWFNINL